MEKEIRLIQSTDIDPSTGKRYIDAREYGQDGRILKLSEKSTAEITPGDLRDINEEEYIASRIWRATSLMDIFVRVYSGQGYRMEYRSIVNS